MFGPAIVEHSLLFANQAFGDGGATHGTSVFNCELTQNEALQPAVQRSVLGGAVYGGLVRNSALKSNRAHETHAFPSFGGGASGATLELCTLTGNRASFGGGAAGGVVDRCTLYGNTADASGGGVFAENGATVANSILWNDLPNEIVHAGGALSVEYSDVLGGWPGTGNIDQDPLFWDAAAGDFHLLAGSPCIDAGDPAKVDKGGTRLDMGAVPYDASWTGLPPSPSKGSRAGTGKAAAGGATAAP